MLAPAAAAGAAEAAPDGEEEDEGDEDDDEDDGDDGDAGKDLRVDASVLQRCKIGVEMYYVDFHSRTIMVLIRQFGSLVALNLIILPKAPVFLEDIFQNSWQNRQNFPKHSALHNVFPILG